VLTSLLGEGKSLALVTVKLAGHIETKTVTEEMPATSFTMGRVSYKQATRLPGLPSIQAAAPRKLSQPVKIRLEAQGKKKSSSFLVTEVKRITVILYVVPDISEELLAQAKSAVMKQAGLNTGRGDKIEVLKTLKRAAPPPREAPGWITPVYMALAVVPLSLLVGAVIISVALGRRQREEEAPEAAWDVGGEARGADLQLGTTGGVGGALDREATVEGAAARRRKRFAPLEEATSGELAHVLAGLRQEEAATVLAMAPIPAGRLKGVLEGLPGPVSAAVATRLGRGQHVVSADLDALEARVNDLMEEARNPKEMDVGGASELARILSWSGRAAALSVLLSLDKELARGVRAQMTLFEDLPKLAPILRRRVLSSQEPGVLALALHQCSEELQSSVYEVLSQRQLRFLEEEIRGLGEVSEEEVEGARETIQHAITLLQSR